MLMRTSSTILLVLSMEAVIAQIPPVLEWQGCFGGTGQEGSAVIAATPDGGLIMATFTQSNDGQVSGNHGGQDVWVVKLDEARAIQWQRCYGGSGNDAGGGVHVLGDSGYIVTAITNSSDGDVSFNHGGSDVWVIRLSPQGDLLWEKTYGGPGFESASRSILTEANEVFIAGRSQQIGGDVTSNSGGSDMWLLRIDLQGVLLWQRSLGGAGFDEGKDLAMAPDGGLLAIAQTDSDGQAVQGNHGGYDMWAVRLDPIGEVVWTRCIGGSANDYGNRLIRLANGDWLATGSTESNDGDVTGYHGAGDGWLTRISDSNAIVWSKAIGGNLGEVLSPLIELGDGSILVGGSTSSNDGDVTFTPLASDSWLLGVSPDGTIQWQTHFGGSGGEGVASLVQLPLSGYAFGTSTTSNDGDVSGNHGGSIPIDAWVFQVSPISSIAEGIASNSIVAYPNPAHDILHLQLPDSWVQAPSYTLFAPSGQVALKGKFTRVHGTGTVDVSGLCTGVYSLVIQERDQMAFGKITIVR